MWSTASDTHDDARLMGYQDMISFWVAHIIIIMGRAHHCDSDSGVVASFFSFLAMPMVVEIGENFPKLQQSLRDFLRGHCRMQHVHVVNLMVLIVEGVTAPMSFASHRDSPRQKKKTKGWELEEMMHAWPRWWRR